MRYRPGELIGPAAPTDCPFPPSPVLKGLSLTGRWARYTNADTWYPSWAADGHLYSSWTDGFVAHHGRHESTGSPPPGSVSCYSLDNSDRRAATAQARIVGDDPMALTIELVGDPVPTQPAPSVGRYPCANLVHDGTWYYGTYALDDFDLTGSRSGAGYDTLGPFVGFRTSSDGGRTWSETRHTPAEPLLGEDPTLAPVQLGVPHVVDFGKNMQHSPDGRIYLTAHASRSGAPSATYIHGDRIHVARVPADPEAVNDPRSWEFFAGHDSSGRARWSSTLAQIAPVARWDDRLGSATATYVAPLERFLMFVTRGRAPQHYDTLVLESRELTGPWSLVARLDDFGPEAYFVNLPSKFVAADGRHGWLCYSANWTTQPWSGTVPVEDPPGSGYAMCLQEIAFDLA